MNAPDPNCSVCNGTGREDDGDRWVPRACLGDVGPKKEELLARDRERKKLTRTQAVIDRERQRYASMAEEKKREYRRASYLKRKAQGTLWKDRNPDLHRQKQAEYFSRPEYKDQAKSLSDHYIKRLLTQRTGLRFADLMPEIVEVKRALLRLKRASAEACK